MKTGYIAPIAILVMLVLAVFSTPAMAQDCLMPVATSSYGTSGTVNGTVYVGGGGYGGNSETFNVPSGSIKWAKVFWHGWMPPDDVTVTFCNATGSCTQNTVHRCVYSDYEGFLHGGCGTSWMWWNVTDIVTNGVNNITVNNADSRWQVLVVVLEKDGYPEQHYWVNNGYQDTGAGSSHTTNFGGPANNSRDGRLWELALCWNDRAQILFNGHVVFDGGGPDFEPLHEHNIPAGWINAVDNSMTWNNIADDWFHPVLAVFIDCTEPKPDLEVSEIYTDPENPDTNPETPRPNRNFTINATIENKGAGAADSFNVSLYINGTFNSEKRVSGGLPAHGSTTVSFGPIKLPEGCHNFTVVADCNGEVGESDEGNNATSVYHQVGYVIVVRSNSDFDKLVNESEEGKLGPDCNVSKRGGTYYIQNCSITNCVGSGITIENTTVPFVINNCTVYHCGYNDGSFMGYYNGISVRNVTDGKITNSTLYNNSDKGISVVESTCIDITNNTISNHTERSTAYGIEIGKVPLSAEDPQFINVTYNTLYHNAYGIELIGFNCTVKGNLVQNNTIYGIYVYGNNSNILLNNIMNSTNYGIKVYNSSENHICWNIFINNNGSVAPQAWDNSQNSNYWNTTNPIGYYYPADTYTDYTNRTGNHWSDYGGSDTNNDGIGDTPYFIAGGDMADYYPLISEHNCIIIGGIHLMTCGDVNCDGNVTGGDVIRLAAHVGHGVSCCCRPPWCPRWAPWVVPPCPTQCCQWWAQLLNGWPMCGQGC